jgi:hypothetical protein
MIVRIFNLALSCFLVVRVLFSREYMLGMAQQASNAGAGVEHVFIYGTLWGNYLALSLFFVILSINFLVSYLRLHRKR